MKLAYDHPNGGPRMARHTPGLVKQKAPVSEPSPERDLYVRALAVLRRNLTDADFSLDAAARQLYVSKRSLQRVFEHHETTFRSSLFQVRMSQATKLLTETRRPIAEIAASVGYRHPMHFSKAYSRRYGMSPRERRRRAGLPARTVRAKSGQPIS